MTKKTLRDNFPQLGDFVIELILKNKNPIKKLEEIIGRHLTVEEKSKCKK